MPQDQENKQKSQNLQNRQELEKQFRKDFDELQKELKNLENGVKTETDVKKKEVKNEKLQELLSDARDLEELLNRFSDLNEEDLQSVKTKLDSIKNMVNEFSKEASEYQQERIGTPTTFDLLKYSETYNRLVKIISSYPDKFKDLPGSTPELKLEQIFSNVRENMVLFLQNKLGDKEKYNDIINNTIAPAFEWNLLELLRDNGNETNVSMLQEMNKISLVDGFKNLVNGVKNFATSATGSYSKFNQWINSIDYLSVHNEILGKYNKSAVLTNPIKFQNYMNKEEFSKGNFSPYTLINGNIFEIDESQNYKFEMSMQEIADLKSRIGNIQVVDSPNTTSLITKMLDKSDQFFGKVPQLQDTANHLLDGINGVNNITKMFGYDIIGEITKPPEKRSILYKAVDFVCKLIGITGGIEGIVKRRRLDRLNLTSEKNENIRQIFDEYQKIAGKGPNISITDSSTCGTILEYFALTNINEQSHTKGDYLRDAIAGKMDLNLVSPSLVKQTLGDAYLKKETTIVDGKQQEKISINHSKITDEKKKELAHKHITNMRSYLSNYNNLKDFYSNIHNLDDLIICVTTSLYANQDDVVEGIKAKVFLPENYGVTYESAQDNNGNGGDNSGGSGGSSDSGRNNLDSKESSDKQVVSEQWMYDKAVEYGFTDKHQIAYILSTVKGECAFKNQEEIGKGNGKDYGKKDSITGHAYYGRGFIQLTWKENYQKYTKIIRDSGKDFKDNDGKTLKGSEIDLVNNPDIILKSNDLAAFILMDWMKNGGPDRVKTKKLSYYINETKTDYYHARSIVNGMSSKPKQFENDALAYENKLGKGSVDSSLESNDLLIGPHLLAHNKDEIGGLGNSIMNGFQGLSKKTNFPYMDGAVGKSTVTHPNRFNSENDVLAYKNSHPNIKSFMFYFGVNTRDNERTLSDIKQRSEWLQNEGIQPVLCTCVGEDKKSWLKELNQKLISLGREKNRPVIDFAKSYNKGDIALSTDGVHPTSYSPMTNIVNGQLSLA